MKKKVETISKWNTVLPGVQRISPKSYRARIQVKGKTLAKIFTNKATAANWYKEQKRLSKTII